MPKVLIINPNTSETISAKLQTHIQGWVDAKVQLETVTATFGAPYISCEYSYAVAGHAVLDAYDKTIALYKDNFDAVLIACFGDPGLWALKERSNLKVTGIAEASFIQASRHGRFAIVTGGVRWEPILRRLVQNLGFQEYLAGIEIVEMEGFELACNPHTAHIVLTNACIAACEKWQVDVVILGGAGIAGMAQSIAPLVAVPLIDSLKAGINYLIEKENA